MKRIFATTVVLALLGLASVAHAEPVQEFNFQIKNIKKDGRYTLVFRSNSFDTTGEPPPLVTDNTVRLAAGVKIRREFLKKDYQCKADNVRDALLAPDGNRSYTKRLTNLAATLKRTRKRIRKGLERGVKTCIRAQVGRGRVLADVRPTFADPAAADLFLYLAKPTKKGAVAAMGVLVVLDENSIFVKNNPFFKTLRLTFTVNIFNDPTPDGRFGYRLDLPGGGAAGVRVSLAEVEVTTPGITRVKRTVKCLRRKKGKCVKKKVLKKQNIFWITEPTCPASSLLDFEAFYKYETGQETTKTAQLPCPRFKR